MDHVEQHKTISTRAQLARKEYLENQLEEIHREHVALQFRLGSRSISFQGLLKLDQLTGKPQFDQDEHRYIMELEHIGTTEFAHLVPKINHIRVHFFNYDHEYMRSDLDVWTYPDDPRHEAATWTQEHGYIFPRVKFSANLRFRDRYVRNRNRQEEEEAAHV